MKKTIANRNFSFIERTLLFSLIVLNVLFLVYWVLLSFNYCLHYDDVHFMWKMREYSIFEFVHEMYMTRGGNFVVYGLDGILFSVSNWVGDYHLWPLIFYALGITITYSAIRDKISSIGKFKTIIAVISIYNVYILTVPDYAVFTWVCAMEYFLFGPAICLMLKYLNDDRLPIWKAGIALLLALFLSGSNVTLTPMVWLLMLVNSLWICRKYNLMVNQILNNTKVKRIVLLGLIMLAFYVVMFVAPGNFDRLESGADMDHPANLFEFGKAWTKCVAMFLYFMSFYMPYHLLAAGLGFLVGTKSNIIIEHKMKTAMLIILSFLIYLGIAVLPLAYLSNGFGLQRNYTQITFFYIITFFVLGFVLSSSNKKSHIGSFVSLISSGLLIVIMAFNLYIDLPLAVAYNKAHIDREELLINLQKQGNKDVIEVDKYPSTATLDAKSVILGLFGKEANHQTIYYESDTDYSPNEYEFHVKKLLGLDYDFVIKQ